MSTLTVIGVLLAILLLSWAAWFAIGLIRYIVNGEDEIDQRLREISR